MNILSRSNLKPIEEIAASDCPCQPEEKCHWAVELNKFNTEIEKVLELKKKVKEIKSHVRLIFWCPVSTIINSKSKYEYEYEYR